MVMVMMQRMKHKMMKSKIDKIGYLFNRQIMKNYCSTAANIKPDAAGTVNIDFHEYQRLKDIEHQMISQTENVLLSDELLQHDLELMNSILKQGD